MAANVLEAEGTQMLVLDIVMFEVDKLAVADRAIEDKWVVVDKLIAGDKGVVVGKGVVVDKGAVVGKGVAADKGVVVHIRAGNIQVAEDILIVASYLVVDKGQVDPVQH